MSVDLTLTLGPVLGSYTNVGRSIGHEPPPPPDLCVKESDILPLDAQSFLNFGFEYSYSDINAIYGGEPMPQMLSAKLLIGIHCLARSSQIRTRVQ